MASAEARLPRWMVLISAVAVVVAFAGEQARFAAGLGLGATVAILAYIWLHQAVTRALDQGAGRLPKAMVFKLVIRYPLALGAVYLFYKTGWLPFKAILLGLFAPLAGALAECFFQVGGAVLRFGTRHAGRASE